MATTRLLLGSCLLLLTLILPPQTSLAHSPRQDAPVPDALSADATIVLMPRANTRLRADALRFDAVIGGDDQETWADITAWLRLHNPLTSTVTLDALVQRADGTPPPQNLQLDANGARQILTAEGETRWRWTAAVPGQQRLEATLTYHVVLGRGAGARLRYTPTRAWGAVGSARLTVRFAPTVASGQFLAMNPPAPRSEGDALVWTYDNAPLAPLDLIFIPTAAWQTLSQAQAAAASAGPEQLAATQALAHWYVRLANLPAPDDLFFARFYPQAIAVLETLWQQTPGQAATASELAALYQQQAARAADEATLIAYRTLATEYLATARTAGAANAEQDAALAALYFDLATRMQNRGEWAAAAQFMEALAQLPAAAQASLPTNDVLALRRRAALMQAGQHLARNDAAAARQTITALWGAEALTVTGAQPASFDAQVAGMTVENRRQLITLTLPLRQPAPALAAVEAQIIELGAQTGVTATAVRDAAAVEVRIEIAFDSIEGLRQQRQQMAARLADLPDLALLRALLDAPLISEQWTAAGLWRTYEISDTLALPQARQALAGQAQRYRQAITELDAAAPAVQTPLTSTVSLSDLQRQIWEGEAAAWETLGRASEVRYRLAWQNAAGAQFSAVSVGRPDQTLHVSLTVRQQRTDVLLAAGAGILLLTLVTAWLWWRDVRR